MLACLFWLFEKKAKKSIYVLPYLLLAFLVVIAITGESVATTLNSNTKEKFTRVIFVNYVCSVSYAIGYNNRSCDKLKKLERRVMLVYKFPGALAQPLMSIMNACCMQGKSDSINMKNSVPYTVGRIGNNLYKGENK